MSSMDSKRSKRRRNKRGNAKAKQKVCNVNSAGLTNVSATANGNVDGNSFSQTHAQLTGNLKKMPHSLPVSELDLDNIPQPLTQMPKSHNPYLDREHCLLCRRERPDTPRDVTTTVGSKESGDGQILNTPPMPLWLCPECRQNVEEEERNSKTFDSPSLPQDVFVSSNLPLMPSPMDRSVDLSTGDGIVGGGTKTSSEEPCSCVKCKEQRLIIAEEEKAKIKLAEYWSELSHMVRCVYLEAGTALADDSSTKLCLPRIAELVQRLCAHDPHQLFLRLEIEVEDFVKEVKERLLKRLGEGYRSSPLAKQFMTMLLEEYASLISASKTLSTVLDKLEKEHLSKFKLTWVLHNKHLFHSMVYLEPDLHNKLSQLLKYLQQGSQKESYHSEESFSKLCQRYLKFSDEMTDLSEGWREHQQLIESYVEKREINRTRELLAQQRTNWEFNFPPFPPPTDPKPHSSHCTHKEKSCLQNGESKESGDHSQCNCKTKCMYQNNRIPHQTALYDNLDEGLIPPQLVSLDGYNYLQSIQPPNLSSLSSSQDDSEEVPIFSRRSCIDPGMCSPCSEDSIDSDDLTSESSQDVPSQDAGYEVDDESESCNYGKQRRNSGSEKLSNGSGSSKADSAYQSNQMCECHACITSAMQNAKLLPPASSVIGATTTDTSTTLTPSELRGQTSPYLFYPNLTNHQPLDLSHHGITAKHPLIHPHLYNLSSQQKPSSQPFQLVNGLSSSEVSAYESAKMSLHSCGYDTDPDLLQSVKDALQTNCKLDKSGLLGSYVRKSKQEEQAAAAAQKVCSSGSSQGLPRDSSVGLVHYNTAQFSVDAWARQQYMAQLQQNGTLPVTSTHTPDCCPKHSAAASQLPRVPSSAAGVKSHPYSNGIAPTSAGSTAVGSSGLIQPISPLVRNLPVTDPEAYSTIKRSPILNPNLGHLAQQPPHHQQLQHQSSCKKKKGATEDVERYHQPGCTMSCCMRTAEYSQDVHQQSVCALHNQPGISLSQGSAVDPVPPHNPGSTSTSASECSDPDCDTHNFNDDDLCGNSDDRSSSTTSSSRERDSKHCGCCYCEVFGHGGPALAPMSRNYPEMRDRLRLKLRERQQIPKDESPSHTHSPNPEQRRNTGIPLDDKKLDDIVKYITGDKPVKTKSSKAAKRQRQKQRKAEQRVKQENQSKNSNCPSKEQPTEKCQNLSTQSTPTKSNKVKTKQPAAEAVQLPSPGSSVDKKDHNGLQDTPPSGKLKGPDKKKSKSTEATSAATQHSAKPSQNPAKSSQNVAATPDVVPSSQKVVMPSQKTTSAATSKSSSGKGDKPSEERRKEKRPKSATVAESSIKEGAKAPSDKKEKKKDTPAEKTTTSSVKQGKKDTGKTVQEVASKAATSKQQGTANAASKPNGTVPAKGVNGAAPQESPSTPRKGKKDTCKKDVGSEDHKKAAQSGNVTAQQGKTEANDQKTTPKTKGKGNEEVTKKPTSAAAKGSNKKTEAPLVNGHPESKNHVMNKPSSKTSGKKTEVPVENGQGKNHVLNKPGSKTGSKKPDATIENGHRDSKDQASSKTKAAGKGNAKINGIIKGAEVVNVVAPASNNKKKKKKKGGEANTSIDDIFLPKEDVDMNKLDEVEQELEAFKRFCMDSTPQRKKEKVVFNVKDIILKKTPSN